MWLKQDSIYFSLTQQSRQKQPGLTWQPLVKVSGTQFPSLLLPPITRLLPFPLWTKMAPNHINFPESHLLIS